MMSEYGARRQTKIPVCVDLFCGAGGLSCGLHQAGIDTICGVDIDKACEYPFEVNGNGRFWLKDITTLSPEWVRNTYDNHTNWNYDIPRILAGCPPCPPFSPLNRSNVNYGEEKKLCDPRTDLLNDYERMINGAEPDIIIMENVPDMIYTDLFLKFLKHLKTLDYHVWYGIVLCADYGVPQSRRRLILLASRYGPITMMHPTHSVKRVTVRDTISHLPRLSHGETHSADKLHRCSQLETLGLRRIRATRDGTTWKDWPRELWADRHKRYYDENPNCRNFLDVGMRLPWDGIGSTITTSFYCYMSGRFGHPDQDRAISLREGALLQTFPADYRFCPDEDITITGCSRLIGNAVPPRIGKVIGESVMHHLATV